MLQKKKRGRVNLAAGVRVVLMMVWGCPKTVDHAALNPREAPNECVCVCVELHRKCVTDDFPYTDKNK